MFSEFDKQDGVFCFIGHQIAAPEVCVDTTVIYLFLGSLIEEQGVSYFQLQLSICL